MKYDEIIRKMSLEEKAAFLGGQNEWQTREFPQYGIHSICFSDGPNGVRRQAGAGDHLGINPSLPATCFPTAATLACSWNEQLIKQVGEAIGKEASMQNVDVLLGPGLNIKRSPLCGRNFEYFSEDPYLSGKLAAAYIRGVQSQGVYACPKHFAANNQELHRMSVDSIIDERTLREIYLTGFEIAVKEGGAKCIMSSYNRINGEYANESRTLLTEILRKEWGFSGFVVTDWGGSDSHIKGVKAGSDLEMPAPGLDSAREIVVAVQNGVISEQEIDDSLKRLLKATVELNNSRNLNNTKNLNNTEKDVVYREHHKLSEKAAAESIVLLKNENEILPIEKKTKVALIGEFAHIPRYQGAGSSVVNAIKTDTIEEMIRHRELQVIGYAQGYVRTGQRCTEKEKAEMVQKAIEYAEQADIVLYCFGLDESFESEGVDRDNMLIPEPQIRLLEKLANTNPNVVGILCAGSPVEMKWLLCCKALLHGYLLGEAGAGAVLDIITGVVNPSGRLAETYPIYYEDTPTYHYYPGRERTAEYRESIFVGYRYYSTRKKTVRFPFGFGMTYTKFQYSDLQIEKMGATFTLKNVGIRDGAEVVQLYVQKRDSQLFRPERELKGFKKIFLKAGEEKTVKLMFDDKTFRYWDVSTRQWETESGEYEIIIGANAEDYRLSGNIEVQGTIEKLPYDKSVLKSYYAGKVESIKDEEFEILLGHALPKRDWSGPIGRNDAVCQLYYAQSRLARMVYRFFTTQIKKNKNSGMLDLNLLFQYNIPFRAIAKMTEGMVSLEMVEGIVEMANGHFGRGIHKVIGGFFRNQRENRKYEQLLEENRGGNVIWKK